MRTLMAVIVIFGATGAAAQDKQAKLDATKLENCPRLKSYFEKRAKSCPKTSEKATALECSTPAEHDTLNGMMRACAKEIEKLGGPEPGLEPAAAEEGPPDKDACRVIDPSDGSVIAAASDKSSTKCKKIVKQQVLDRKCDGKVKTVKAKYQRRDKPPVAMPLKCPKKV
jgi:hypothetical protein